MPKLFILTGSNGAGKSTVGPIYFPQDRRFHLFDSLKIIDTSEAEHRVLTILENGLIKEFSPITEMPSWIKEYLPEIYSRCASNETH